MREYFKTAKPNLNAFMGHLDFYAEVAKVKGNAAITASVAASVTTPPGKFTSKEVTGITVSEATFLWKGHKWNGTKWLEDPLVVTPSDLKKQSSYSGSHPAAVVSATYSGGDKNGKYSSNGEGCIAGR